MSSQGPPPVPRPIEPPGMFEGIRPGAILVGALVDIVATLACGTILVVALAGEHAPEADGEIPQEALEAITTSPEFLIGSFVLGMLCTVLGGFVGARRAGVHHLRHGAFVALASLLISLVFYLEPTSNRMPPLWYDLLGVLVMIPAGVAGGWLALRTDPGQR